jgi:hypothetical protein
MGLQKFKKHRYSYQLRMYFWSHRNRMSKVPVNANCLLPVSPYISESSVRLVTQRKNVRLAANTHPQTCILLNGWNAWNILSLILWGLQHFYSNKYISQPAKFTVHEKDNLLGYYAVSVVLQGIALMMEAVITSETSVNFKHSRRLSSSFSPSWETDVFTSWNIFLERLHVKKFTLFMESKFH